MRSTSVFAAALVGAAGLGLTPGCGRGGSGGAPPAPKAGGDAGAPATGTPAPGAKPTNGNPALSPEESALIEKYKSVLDIPKVRYEWDRNAGDKSVSAELGGPGFTGEGWTTNLEFPAIGMPGAPKGGSLRMEMDDWPATLRQAGENWNTSFNYTVNELCVESLLTLHPTTLEYIPRVATHWKISDDKQTYTFRINPDARFSDGSEVTALDVVANWKFLMDPKLRSPSNITTYEKYNEPVAQSKYVVEVRCKQDNWRNFLYFSGMSILPAKEISIGGEAYLDKYQNAYTAMSGPYTVRAEDVKMGQSITITRRSDWWGAKNPAFAGMYNLDRIEFEVVKDQNLALEKAKKGELDLFVVNKAQWWAEEIPKLDAVKRGLLVMKKIYNDHPIGTSGIAINMKKAPLDDVRIRRALQLLFNRLLMIEKLFFKEYEPLKSYEYGVWSNPDNVVHDYDPVGAVELLEQAGWKDLNKELIRVKDGKALEFELMYSSSQSERHLTTYQEDCKKAGINIKLKLLTPASAWKTLTQKEYEIATIAWGALIFPNPETSWKSDLADKTGNNNVTAFKSARVDELLKEYDKAYDVQRRIEVIREIDAILYKEHPYVLGWFLPSVRFVYWNKYGMPPWGTTRIQDAGDSFWSVFWVDPQKERALEEARRDASKSLPLEDRENKFWRAWAAANRQREANK